MMNLNKIVLSLCALMLAPVASANEGCPLKVRFGGGPWSAQNEIRSQPEVQEQIRAILESKGYLLTEAEDAKYKLSVGAGTGVACGTGVSWINLNVLINYQASVYLEGGPREISRRKEGFFLISGGVQKVMRKALKLVRKLPDCDELDSSPL
jgi:hypothetical protein